MQSWKSSRISVLSRTAELDQGAPRVMAEVSGKDPGPSALEFLRATVDAADRFQRLGRAQQLAPMEPAEMTEADRKLLNELTSDPELAPYLAGLTG